MAKKAKITAASIAKAMGLVDTNTITIACGMRENTIEIPVKARLSVTERAMMVSDIVNMIFIADENGARYCPAFKKFAIEYNIVTYFTDVALPSDSNKACKFLEQSGLANRIAQSLPDGYVVGIISDANEEIEYRKQELLKRSKLDDILDGVLGVVQALSDKTEGIELPQIMEYVEKNMPEFKGQLEQLISAQTAGATATA